MQKLALKIRGLYIDPNNFSEVPEGALVKADNFSIDKDSVAENRRGFNFYGSELTDGIDPVETRQMFAYKNRLIVHYNDLLAYDSDGLGTFVDYPGNYNAPEVGFRMRSVQANRNLYFTTSEGISKLDALTVTPIDAGAPKALGGSGVTSGSSGWMNDDKQVAYRILWGYKDLNNNLILGPPSQRIIVVNPAAAGTKDVTLTFQIPAFGITTDWFFQVYRSPESASATSQPSDEMQLVYEANPTSGELSALQISFTDLTPDELKGAALYTNPTQGGILEANDAPPFAKDIAYYKTFTLFANTRSKQRYSFTLISVGSPGFVIDDTITIAGQTYTGKSAQNNTNREFKVTTAGTPAENIALTAIALVEAINANTSNTTVYGYYQSGFQDLPGQILIEERDVGGAVFTVASSNGDAFNPEISSAQDSNNDEAPNRIYFSKSLQPESVPILNFLEAGSKDAPIQRIIALRDSVFIFKPDGIFRFYGESPANFTITLLDNTSTIQAPESAVAFNNQVYLFSDQGVVGVSDSGVQVLSRPIESDLLKIATYPAFENSTFAVSYESERKYILFTLSNPNDTVPTTAYVLNSFTNAWTKWSLSERIGFVNPADNKLYLASSSDGWIYKERKNYDKFDFADLSYAVSITGSIGQTVTLADVSNVVVGMALSQGSSAANILAIDGLDLTVDIFQSWQVAAAEVYEPIQSTLEWVSVSAENPGILKQWRELTLVFRDASFADIEVSFRSNFSRNQESVTLTAVRSAAWGAFPWGQEPWGGGVGGRQALRTYIPLNKQRCLWINPSIVNSRAFTSLSLEGVSFIYEPMSERFF